MISRRLPFLLLSLLLSLVTVSVQAAPRQLLQEESKVEFVVKEMGVPVQGSFRRVNGTIDIDPASVEKSSVVVRVEIASLYTGNAEADALAVGPEWLDKAGSPFATFNSTAIRDLGKGRFEARGTLEIRNRRRDVTFQFAAAEQAGGRTLVTSEFTLKRSEWGIGGGEWNEPGVVAEEIPVKVRLMLAAPRAVAR